jgi:hypothetical protein
VIEFGPELHPASVTAVAATTMTIAPLAKLITIRSSA